MLRTTKVGDVSDLVNITQNDTLVYTFGSTRGLILHTDELQELRYIVKDRRKERNAWFACENATLHESLTYLTCRYVLIYY